MSSMVYETPYILSVRVPEWVRTKDIHHAVGLAGFEIEFEHSYAFRVQDIDRENLLDAVRPFGAKVYFDPINIINSLLNSAPSVPGVSDTWRSYMCSFGGQRSAVLHHEPIEIRIKVYADLVKSVSQKVRYSLTLYEWDWDSQPNQMKLARCVPGESYTQDEVLDIISQWALEFVRFV